MVDNNKFLLDCVKKTNLAKARILLENGANPNHIDVEEGVSPMHIAAGIGIEPLCLLLQFYGDPNIRVHDGTTPVHVSAIWGIHECMQILLANGGNPYLTDQDGLSAVDFAAKYKHDDVMQVLNQYKYELNLEEEQTITPKYTFKRLSVESVNSQPIYPRSENSSYFEDSDANNESVHDQNHSSYKSTELRKDLREFACRRRSSVYLKNIQQQLDRYISSGNRTHLIDVTSPDHPYIDLRGSFEDNHADHGDCDTINSENSSLCLHLSSSTNDDQSCDSFVTCNGEDPETMIQKSLHDSNSPLVSSPDSSPLCENVETVKKNPKYFNYSESKCGAERHRSTDLVSDTDSDRRCNSVNKGNKTHRNGYSRTSKYCRRIIEPILQSQDLYETEVRVPGGNHNQRRNENVNNKCDFCGGVAEKDIDDKAVCLSCEELGLELDRLVCESEGNKYDILNSDAKSKQRKSNNGKNLTNRSRSKYYDKLNEAKSDAECMKTMIDKLEQTKLNKGTVTYQKHDIEQSEKSDATNRVSSNTQFGARDLHIPNRFEDSILSTVSSTVNELDRGRIWNDSILTSDDTFMVPECVSPEKYLLNKSDVMIPSGAMKLRNEHSESLNTEKITSEEYDDLWTQVQASKHKRQAHKDRIAVLDTGFCGRDSMSSMFSDGSTIDYVYTDQENGITLVERHIPSVCGSQGSRRSIDSQFSIHTDVDCALYGHESDSSQDTVLYNWRDNAMIMSRDSGRGDSCQTDSESCGSSSQTGSMPLSQDLLKLKNEEIRKQLTNHGDNPGPVNMTTRQCYLNRLNKYENDPNYKQVCHKSPEYPLELKHALSGNLDMSEMPALESKMVAAFQNPDRLRRWREGTLKSSFNYILLDPRITKNLPNRSCNMSDLDVFSTFITAIFYIGKGKRARPYSHLYEAIKQQRKNVHKVSKKVHQIQDIWNSGLGVVSLHCFQSVIPVEAYTREACMVDAIGLAHLTNMKRGDYYGISVTFTMKERRKMGVFLLKKALQIFLAEGERQIAPLDIKKE